MSGGYYGGPLGGFLDLFDRGKGPWRSEPMVDLGDGRYTDYNTYSQLPKTTPRTTSGIYNSADLNARKQAADRQMAALKEAQKTQSRQTSSGVPQQRQPAIPKGPLPKPTPKQPFQIPEFDTWNPKPVPRKSIPWTQTKEVVRGYPGVYYRRPSMRTRPYYRPWTRKKRAKPKTRY